MARRRMRRIGWADCRLLVETGLLVVGIRAGLAIVTVRTLRRWLAAAAARSTAPAADPIERIAWAVTAASDRIPGTTCLPRAIAADVLLRRRHVPAQLRIAIARSGTRGLDGHAWVESDGRVVVGPSELDAGVPRARLTLESP